MHIDGLNHLPQRKQEELAQVDGISFDEFEAARKNRQKDEHRCARILKINLFGSYARGGWVEDRKSGYRSDYDLAERFTRELTITKQLETRSARRCFSRTDRAYVEARYSAKYSIMDEELNWVVERVTALRDIVETICRERLDS